MKSSSVLILFMCSLLFTTNSYSTTYKQQAKSNDLVIFLVRHGEKLTGDDPKLSETGQLRVKSLANILVDAQLNRIYSTDYNRTKETALAVLSVQPALKAGKLYIYNPSDLATFSQQLLGKTGRYLVVGHSNTTTELVALLGGEVTSSIDDKTEFDRLYILHISHDSTEGQKQNVHVTTTLLHY